MTLAVINTQESRNTGSHIRRPRVGGTRFKVIRVRTIIDRSPELSFLNFHSRGGTNSFPRMKNFHQPDATMPLVMPRERPRC